MMKIPYIFLMKRCLYENIHLSRMLCPTSLYHSLPYFFFQFESLGVLLTFYLTLVQFGEVAPSLLKDYCVPHLFQEDFFDILDTDKRPSYRWLIIGPERSGASWHVDPALTSAWNTLLAGRKR